MKTSDILSKLTGILSESGNEKEVSHFIEDWMAKNTPHTTTRIGNNILVYIPGKNNNKCLLFNGHVDTVKIGDRSNWHTDPLKLTGKDQKLFGLGASDMKGAVAAMMEMAARYNDDKPACDLYCMFVAEEETTGNGTNDTLNYLKSSLNKYQEVAAVIGESTRLNAVLGHRGNAFIKVTFTGTGGHASRPPQTANQAVFKAQKFISSIEQQMETLNKRFNDGLLGGVSITVTGLDAGTGAMNQIPTDATVTLDVRTVPSFHAVLKEEFTEWVQRFAGDLEILYPCPAGFCDPSEPIAKIIMNLAGQTEVQVTQGATDQQFFTQAGIPAVICGPGDKAVIHAPNEYIEKDLLDDCAERYMKIISAWAAFSGQKIVLNFS